MLPAYLFSWLGISIQDGEFFWAEPPPKKEEPKKKKKGGGKGATPEASPAGKGRMSHSKSTDSLGTPDGKAAANGAAAAANGQEEDGVVAVKLDGMEDGAAAPAEGEDAASAAAAAPAAEQAGGRNVRDPHWWLRDVNLEVGPGELVCVVGRVGSGKSSLVQAVLGEMEQARGSVGVGGRIAYAGQQAWIVNATVKGNVTFGKDFDEAKWVDCVEVRPAGGTGLP